MQDARTTLKKLVQLGAFTYLLVAVIYTTTYFVAYPLSTLASSVFPLYDFYFLSPALKDVPCTGSVFLACLGRPSSAALVILALVDRRPPEAAPQYPVFEPNL